MSNATPEEITKELDRLAKSHANAKTFYEKLNDISRRRLAPIYTQWKTGYPIKPFKVAAYRQFRYLYDLGIDDEDSIANMEYYKKPLTPPPKPKRIDATIQERLQKRRRKNDPNRDQKRKNHHPRKQKI